MSDAYRSSFRVDEVTRALEPSEDAEVRARRDAWHRALRRRELRSANELLLGVGVALAVAGVGVLVDAVGFVVMGGVTGTGLGVFSALARRRAQRRVADARGPWDPPPEGWRVREYAVVARSVVSAVSGDEDHATWLLFEVPGGDWGFLDPAELPDAAERDPAALARAELRVVQLWPEGEVLDVDLGAQPIPWRGASGRADDYADDLEAGYAWAPWDWLDEIDPDGELPLGTVGRVPEHALPAWIRRAAGRR
ncbi:MAG TPA: hypothetical protein RMH99_09795 [Sandaracinaceae bacterium LLY-WYZ-13_1]|nr:hypothetical protein [Sandaracinaceae bacterium LLY-WYZ-13_1]